MISREALEKIAKHYKMSLFPTVIREYCQHLFLSQLYKISESEKLLFKGGTALRIIYGSPRFSEDLDFSLYSIEKHDVKSFVEDIFLKVLTEIGYSGISVQIGSNTNPTTGGYFATAVFKVLNFEPISIEINISNLSGKENVRGEVDNISSDFVSTYSIIHLPQEVIVDEKIFDALCERKKPRDFYDLYFMMRRNMLSSDQKQRLVKIQNRIEDEACHIDFGKELREFLPVDQQSIIRDFGKTLKAEMQREL